MDDIVKLGRNDNEKIVKEKNDITIKEDIKKLMQWHNEQYGALVNKVSALEAKVNLLLDKGCDPSYQVKGCILKVTKPDER